MGVMFQGANHHNISGFSGLSVECGDTFVMYGYVYIVAKADKDSRFLLVNLHNGNRWSVPETIEGINRSLSENHAIPVQVTATVQRKG